MKTNEPDLLENSSKRTPFDVPPTYFAEFPSQIQNRIISQKPSSIISWQGYKKPVLAFASFMLICTFGWYTVSYFTVQKAVIASKDNTAMEEVLAYETTQNQIVEYVITENNLQDEVLTDQEENSIFEYVSSEEVDLSNISLE